MRNSLFGAFIISLIVALIVCLGRQKLFQVKAVVEIKSIQKIENPQKSRFFVDKEEIEDFFRSSPILNYMKMESLPYTSDFRIRRNKISFIVNSVNEENSRKFIDDILLELRKRFASRAKKKARTFLRLKAEVDEKIKELEEIKNGMPHPLKAPNLSVSEKADLTNSLVNISNLIWDLKLKRRVFQHNLEILEESGFNLLFTKSFGENLFFLKTVLLFLVISSLGPLLILTVTLRKRS